MDAKTCRLTGMFVRGLHYAVVQCDYLDTSITTMYIDRAFDVGTAVIFEP